MQINMSFMEILLVSLVLFLIISSVFAEDEEHQHQEHNEGRCTGTNVDRHGYPNESEYAYTIALPTTETNQGSPEVIKISALSNFTTPGESFSDVFVNDRYSDTRTNFTDDELWNVYLDSTPSDVLVEDTDMDDALRSYMMDGDDMDKKMMTKASQQVQAALVNDAIASTSHPRHRILTSDITHKDSRRDWWGA
jgi:hypothetical protein